MPMTLVEFISSGHFDTTQYLFEEGATFDSDPNQTPLHIAAALGRDSVVEKLIASGADVNTRNSREGRSPIFAAISEGIL